MYNVMDPIPAGIASKWGPGLCWCVQPQTNPSWDCYRHFCDIPTYNVTDPIPAGIASSGDLAYAGVYSRRPIPAGIASSGDPAYASVYSCRPIPAGIALVTFVTFPHIMSQAQSQLGLLSRGAQLMLVSIATDQSQLGLLE